VVKAPKFSHIILRSLHWLKTSKRIEYKLFSLTYKVLTTGQPDYLHNLISVQTTGRTRSSSAVTPALLDMHHLTCGISSLLHSVNLILFSVHCPPGSPHPAHITSSQSPPSLSSSVTPLTFHSRLKTHLFHKSFPP